MTKEYIYIYIYIIEGPIERLTVIHSDSHLFYTYGWLIGLSPASQLYITLIPRFEYLFLMEAVWMSSGEVAEVKSVHG